MIILSFFRLLVWPLLVMSCQLEQVGCASKSVARYELKFQSEIDNSSISKREGEQQVFKCQVRIAPVSAASSSGSLSSLLKKSRARFRSRQFPLHELRASELVERPMKENANWPVNVSLSIHWMKDNQQLVGSSSEPVSVLNVELKTNASSSSEQEQKVAGDKKANKPRLEIKNTSNGNQLKLTSRLRLTNLKATDSGQYKCLAQASFVQANNTHNLNSSELVQVEQTLESNGAKLSISARSALSSNPGEEEAKEKEKEKEHPALRQPANDIQHAKFQSTPLNNSARFESHATHLPASDTDEAKTGKRIVSSLTGSQPMSFGDNITKRPHVLANQFEDDEDLFKLDSDRIEFISKQLDTNMNALNDDDETTLLQRERSFASHPFNDWYSRSLFSPPLSPNSNSNSNSNWNSNSNELTERDNESSRSRYIQQKQQHHHNHQQQEQTHNVLETNYITGSEHNNNYLHSTKLKLAKLVHKIAPELSCYTGRGEHYRGNVSTSADGRPCLNWIQFRLNSSAHSLEDNNHNYCRNPNLDPRGPWCFVHVLEQQLAKNYQDALSFTALANDTLNNNKYSASLHILQWPCAIAPCSQYLWLYIVAPPLGLLIILSCGLVALVRTIRKAHYNSVFSTGKTKFLPKFSKLIRPRSKFAPKQLVSVSKKSRANYLDDDIFEIADDLDWTDGQTQSTSPRSSESLKLDSSIIGSTISNKQLQHNGSACKSLNPIFGDCALNKPEPERCTKSNTRVGPMFATLRCHIRESLKPANQMNTFQRRKTNKSSTFIEHCDLAVSKQNVTPEWQVSPQSPGTDSSSVFESPGHSEAISRFTHNEVSHSSTSGSHLISCSTTTEDIEESAYAENAKCIRACELPQISASSILILSDQQPIYEGKFSQVQMAQVKYFHDSTTAATKLLHSTNNGAQVAAFSLKANSAIDPTIFRPTTIRLHNLNHLNLLKLVGYAQISDEIGLKQSSTSLIYDMTHLVDLNDWLKQQSKDILTSNSAPGADLGIKRNLTCFAKQIALALDYLHDQGIVYKDLACRNCFLDPTKMLIKLATFNVELQIPANDVQAKNLKSMIRPKYLLDYYMIDSRPSDCQLLPLSWIPLESILFNKFNKQTDVWSFGCLIYELFSLGEVAYFGYSSKQIIDSVRSNLMPPQPLLCPSGIYKLMCKCLNDIPIIRPDVKQIYEQLNLYSGQCSSFLDHHLCSLASSIHDDQVPVSKGQLIEMKSKLTLNAASNNSISKTKSYANMKNYSPPSGRFCQDNSPTTTPGYDNLAHLALDTSRPEVVKLPTSKSINLGSNKLASSFGIQGSSHILDKNHYDEPVVEKRDTERNER